MKKLLTIEHISITNGSLFNKGNYTRVVYSNGEIEWYFEWLTISELKNGISLGRGSVSKEKMYKEEVL
jgi:hypothetical protein